MKSVLELNEKKASIVRIDNALNKYDNIVLFPKKVAEAKKTFEKFGVPALKKQSR